MRPRRFRPLRGLEPLVARECAKIVDFYVDRCRAEETRVRIAKEGWRLVRGDRMRQALLLEVPYRLFGAGIFAGTEQPGEMEVGKKELREKLPLLCARLAEHGIELCFEEKPVRPAARVIAAITRDDFLHLLGG